MKRDFVSAHIAGEFFPCLRHSPEAAYSGQLAASPLLFRRSLSQMRTRMDLAVARSRRAVHGPGSTELVVRCRVCSVLPRVCVRPLRSPHVVAAASVRVQTPIYGTHEIRNTADHTGYEDHPATNAGNSVSTGQLNKLGTIDLPPLRQLLAVWCGLWSGGTQCSIDTCRVLMYMERVVNCAPRLHELVRATTRGTMRSYAHAAAMRAFNSWR